MVQLWEEYNQEKKPTITYTARTTTLTLFFQSLYIIRTKTYEFTVYGLKSISGTEIDTFFYKDRNQYQSYRSIQLSFAIDPLYILASEKCIDIKTFHRSNFYHACKLNHYLRLFVFFFLLLITLVFNYIISIFLFIYLFFSSNIIDLIGRWRNTGGEEYF